jgi:hypothetical protein
MGLVLVWRVDVLRVATRPTMVRHMQRSPFCLQVAGQDAELPIVNPVGTQGSCDV